MVTQIKKTYDLKGILTVITIVGIFTALVGQWYTHKAAVEQLQKNYNKLEDVMIDYKSKNDEKMLQMKLDIGSSSSDINTIKQDIKEIKMDIKTILKLR